MDFDKGRNIENWAELAILRVLFTMGRNHLGKMSVAEDDGIPTLAIL